MFIIINVTPATIPIIQSNATSMRTTIIHLRLQIGLQKLFSLEPLSPIVVVVEAMDVDDDAVFLLLDREPDDLLIGGCPMRLI